MKGAYRWRLKHNFNPRAPCGARHYYHTAIISDKQFQSTRPVRGATWRWISSRPTTCYFNPRAPCGARPVHTYLAPYIPAISIHAPRAGRDISRRFPGLRFWISIHAPRAGRDCLQSLHRVTDVISIHAPRAGRDAKNLILSSSNFFHFNPRAPCGARLPMIPNKPVGDKISIHAPRAGRD